MIAKKLKEGNQKSKNRNKAINLKLDVNKLNKNNTTTSIKNKNKFNNATELEDVSKISNKRKNKTELITSDNQQTVGTNSTVSLIGDTTHLSASETNKPRLGIANALKQLLRYSNSSSTTDQIIINPGENIKITVSKVEPETKVNEKTPQVKDEGKEFLKNEENKENEKEKDENFQNLKMESAGKLSSKGKDAREKAEDIFSKSQNASALAGNSPENTITTEGKPDAIEGKIEGKDDNVAPHPIEGKGEDDTEKDGNKGKEECSSKCTADKTKSKASCNAIKAKNNTLGEPCCCCCNSEMDMRKQLQLGNPTPTSKSLRDEDFNFSVQNMIPTARPTTRPTVVNPKKILEPQCKNGICDVEGYCKGKKTGTYPNQNDCQRYWICVGGKTYPAICPAGLVYNYKIFQCDDRSAIPTVLEEWYWATCNTKKSAINKYKYRLKNFPKTLKRRKVASVSIL